jgi:hypothetical protein
MFCFIGTELLRTSLSCVCLPVVSREDKTKRGIYMIILLLSRSLSDCWPVKSKILVSKEFTTLQLFPISSLFQTVM